MKVIIAGGGTGGHIFPAVSVAEEILGRDGLNEVLFVGTKTGLENEILSKRGYRIEHITARGMKGSGMVRSVKAVFAAITGISDSMSILKSFKPDIVLGVGGYVSGPMVLAASLRGVPTAICEQNAYPGIANRILGKFVKKVFTTFDAAAAFFPRGKVVMTGNPIRRDIISGKPGDKDPETLTILVFGGSQGARRLNVSVPEALSMLGRKDLSVIHQTGAKDAELVKIAYENYGIPARVMPFIDDMAGSYAEADFVIARSGAGTVAEITALGKPSLLIPYPYATNDHQTANARSLERAGAAVVMADSEAEPGNLREALTNVLRKDKLDMMSRAALELGRPGAASDIVDRIYMLAGAD
ncbi:MAG: undecaprenyldiphospho-muramoylpentapeptide beta-N-acetylglucosaminyltransferase [Candidatus Dadabacteria bacterium]|nr:undecaprenyldiphospho-muramoylpentapeptide beta-N-acetylglucosaminyltransferase [Candidatus Dadabacteria bacterium]